jgi:UDP-N-acetyl-D-glucosamine dehydrogenase
MEMASVTDLDAALVASDCVVIATDHDAYDWAQIGERAQLIVDTRRAVRPVPAPAGAA